MDKLPQLSNVFRGEMSLVGPRPPSIPAERWTTTRSGSAGAFPYAGADLHLADLPKPKRCLFCRMDTMDLETIDNGSPFLDFKILAQTALVVLTGYRESVLLRSQATCGVEAHRARF